MVVVKTFYFNKVNFAFFSNAGLFLLIFLIALFLVDNLYRLLGFVPSF